MRNEIEEILKEAMPYATDKDSRDTAKRKILSLLEESLPDDEPICGPMPHKENAYCHYLRGWNACRQAMLDNLERERIKELKED